MTATSTRLRETSVRQSESKRPESDNPDDQPREMTPPHLRESTVGDLLQFAGTWEGDDFEECLELVLATRSQVKA